MKNTLLENKNTINVDSLLDGIDAGDYGEYLNDYRGSSAYICDAISEIADNYTSIYYYDIIKFISNNVEAVNDTINEFGWDGCGEDLYKAGQLTEYCQIQNDIYNHLSDSLIICAVDYIKYDLKLSEIPEELAESIKDWTDAADNNDRMSDITDQINDFFAGEEDDDE